MSRKKPEVFEELVPVGTKLPRPIVETIKKKIIHKEFVSISDYIRHLIREDLERRGIHFASYG